MLASHEQPNFQPTDNSKSYLFPFALVCSLFFLWGIANSLNGSLIRHFQFALDLKERWQAGLVDSAFYLGYFVMAIPAGIFMRKFGYKNGVLTGLALYAIGAFLFYPAANVREYAFFLCCLFTIASGLAFLETAANLYVTVLGSRDTAEWRINFAQSFNGISIILGPVIGSLFIFNQKEYTKELLATMTPEAIAQARVESALSVQGPYLTIGIIVSLVALLFWMSKLPEVGTQDNTGKPDAETGIFALLFKYPRLLLGVIAQFANVGAQATLWGYFADFKVELAKDQHLGIVSMIYNTGAGATSEKIANYHLSIAFVLFMLGRFVGTALMSRFEARKVVIWYSIAAVALIGTAFVTGGFTAIICIMLAFFCQSIMFPTIFALATKGLNTSESKLASSLVIMAIVGGAVMPPLAGKLTDAGGMLMALLIPLVCFGFIVWYLWRYPALRQDSATV